VGTKVSDSKHRPIRTNDPSVLAADNTADSTRFAIGRDWSTQQEGRPILAVAELVRTFATKYNLSPQETKVLLAFLPSGSNKAASSAMGIGYTTVKLYWTRIFKKVGCIDQWAVIYLLLELGLDTCPNCRRSDDL
jgi:DNA-binding NarL/FixJ family response regulator